MNIKLNRERFQRGSLTREGRNKGPDVWVYRWRQPIGPNKTKQRKMIVGTIKELTKAQAHKRIEAHREVEEVPDEKRSLIFSELADHYMLHELGEQSTRSAKVTKTYRYILNNYVLPRWGSSPLLAIKAVAVEDWLKVLPLANGSRAKVREVFGAVFRHAMRHEIHSTNPIAHVRQVRKRLTDPSILEPNEIGKILVQLQGVEPVRTAFLIASVMGMRRGEIFGLKWADADLESAVLHVRRSYVDGVEGPPKTDSSRRPLPLPPGAVDALTAWKQKSKYTRQDQWIFASEFHFGHQPLWPGTLWRRNVVPAIEAAGIEKPKLGWHTLRRSYASLLLSSGVSLRVSMELMRHSTAEMTLATYAQTVGEEKRDAGERIAALVLNKVTKTE